MTKPTTFPPQKQSMPGHESRMHPKPEVIRDHYRGSGKLDGKIALVTGGDSGIGRAVAVHFAREGADIAIVYLEEHEDAEETRQMIEKEGRRCVLIPGDIRQEEFCRQSVEKTVKEFGRLDILVNNASLEYAEESMDKVDAEYLDRTFQPSEKEIFANPRLNRRLVPKDWDGLYERRQS